ncbi:TPA: DUF551 domain-containing protein [Klebsiella pneumoniae]|nr:DUF551 domain-containing protein [Klebsiella pneumoniae]
MTSKLTREQLHERARENVKALKMASRQTAFESAREEILADLQLAELALAALDSEPVAWTDEQELRDVDRGGCGYLFTVNPVTPHADERRIILLYRHAQPAPVVPEKCPAEIRDLISSHTDALFNDDDAQEIWNACRSAMLAAAPQSPGSDLATVPGKWIPVSERVPVEFEAVIAFDGDYVYGEAMYSSDDGFTIDGYDPCDRLNLQNVTHWMPLPAAPQEVKSES